MNGLALCAGYGGLELGIERVFDEYRTVCYVEGEAFAASHLIKKMEEGSMDDAPIWSNVKTFEGERWRGKVDIISGGFPCQPYSTAGKQMGEDDPRDLWPDFVRIIGEVRPGFLFFENVPNVVKLRINEIILDLDKLGYSCSWGNLAASQVGARHKRNRWFLFGVRNANNNGLMEYANEESREGVTKEGKLEGNRFENISKTDSNANDSSKCSSEGSILQKRRDDIGGLCEDVSNTNNKRLCPRERGTDEALFENGETKQDDNRRGSINVKPQANKESSNVQKDVSNTNSKRSPESRELFKGANGAIIDSNGETGEAITDPNFKRIKRGKQFIRDIQKERQGKGHLDQSDKWGGGFDSWWEVEPSMGRLVDGAADWVDKLRLLGNGVVPQQAAYALQILGERLACGVVENRTPKD